MEQGWTGLMEMMIWNVVLTAIVALLGFVVKEKFAELNRLGILLNKTREEVARDNITRSEVHRDMEKIMERFDAGISRLEAKIDDLRKEQKGRA
jgi:hypothetical protein